MLPPPFEKTAVSREGQNPVHKHRASNCLRHMHRMAHEPSTPLHRDGKNSLMPWIVGTSTLPVALAPRLGRFGVPKIFSGCFCRRGEEVLKAHARMCRKQLLALCLCTGFRPSRDTAVFSKGGGSMLLLVRDLAP